MNPTNAQTISILGCGWLGLPLARHLYSIGYSVKGSTTSLKKVTQLKIDGIEPSVITLTPELKGEDIELFFDSDILFLNIPFKRDLEDPVYFQDQIQSVVKEIERSKIHFVIFASSTSVYPENIGEALEDKAFEPTGARSKVLYHIEQMLLKNDAFESTIIRFAGLYGPDRPIGRFMSGRRNVNKGGSQVNLIHLDDCIAIVAQVIEKQITGEIINACCDTHPVRSELYSKAAQNMGLEPPTFVEEPHYPQKIVSNQKLKSLLQYQFKYPNPMESLR